MIGLPFPLSAGIYVLLFSMALSLFAQTPASQFSGMVWERHGNWHINGSSNSVRLGEAVAPGSLLTGSVSDGVHSLVVLMPDGQHLLCECFDARTCNQGFRVPAITPSPTPAVWNMFTAVSHALLLQPANAEAAFSPETGRDAMAGHRQLVAAIEASGEFSLAPVLDDLPGGRYTLVVSRDDPRQKTPSNVQTLNWVAPRGVASLRADGAGLYRVQVFDERKVSRLDIDVLAVPPAIREGEAAGLTATRKTVLQWSTSHPGWSLHDFLRAYLQSRAVALATN